MTGQAATTQVGTAMRLKRVIDPAGVSIICALDHGMTSPTFLEPLAAIGARTAEVVAGGANVIMMSKGMIRLAEPAFSPTTSLALLLSASANPADPQPEVIQIAQVEEAVRLGADAVVLFTALGGDTEAGMIRTLAGVGRECAALGMPLIAEAEFPTTYAAVEQLKEQYGFEYLRRNVRLCAELGADIVKTNWPGDGDAFADGEDGDAAGAVTAGDVVMQRAAFAQRHADQVTLGGIGRLADRLRHLARLAVAEADAALLVADDDQRGEAEAPAALHDLRHPVDEDDPLFVRALLLVPRVIASRHQIWSPPSRAPSATAATRPW